MVRHDFKCVDCGFIDEIFHEMHADVAPLCHCGGSMRKIFAPLPTHFMSPNRLIRGLHREMTVNEYVKRKEESPEVKSGKLARVGERWV